MTRIKLSGPRRDPNAGFKLVDETTGDTITIGDKRTTFRGEPVTVTGWRVPAHSGSTGRVYVSFDGEGYSGEYFPSVIDAVIVPV